MVAKPGPDRSPDIYKEVPRRLLPLYQKAHEGGLDGKGFQAWLDWEMEALLWEVPAEISGAELGKLVEDE